MYSVFYQATKSAPNKLQFNSEKKKVLYKPQLSKTELLSLGRRVTQKGLMKERNFEEVIK